MDFFTVLPDVLYHIISKYLSYCEKMSLISCNTSLYRWLFKKERMIRIDETNIVKFFYNLDFQQMILEKIESPLDQLIILNSGNYFRVMNGDDLHVPHLNGLNTLELPINIYVKLNESYPNYIPVVQNLRIGSSCSEEIEVQRIIPFLQHVTKSIEFVSLQNLPEELSLPSSIEILSFEYCEVMINKLSSPLPNLRVINLVESYVSNLNDFHHLQELSIDDAQFSKMSDYSILNKVKKLNIRNFQNLFDFTSLQETEEINIFTWLDDIDYSKSFKKSKKITIDSCGTFSKINIDLSYYSQVEDFTLTGENVKLVNGLAIGIIPPTLQRLQLANVSGFTNLVGFEHLKKISLLNCPNIISLSGLKGVPSIHLSVLVLTALEGFEEKRDVWIESCDNITDFSPLKYVNRVTVVNCKGFTDASHLDHVSHVTVTSCDGLEDVSGFRNAESVDLSDCPLVKSVEVLKDVKKLKVTDCELLNC